MTPPNRAPEFVGKFAALNRLLADFSITADQLGKRWNYSVQALSNARSNGSSPLPHWRTPTGGIRYYMRDVLAAELAGSRGPLSLDRVEAELMFMPEVSAELQAAIMTRLRALLEPVTE